MHLCKCPQYHESYGSVCDADNDISILVLGYTVESFIFVGLKFHGFQISDKLVGIKFRGFSIKPAKM